MQKALLALVVILSLHHPLAAQPLAERVPDDAIFYLGWTGSSALPPAYAGSHLQGLLNESNVPKLFTQFFPQLIARIVREQPDAREPLQIVQALAVPMWKYPTAFFFNGIEFEAGGDPLPKFGLICKAGADAAALHQQLSQLLARVEDAPFPIEALQDGDLVGVVVGYADPKAALAGAGRGAINASGGFKSALAQVEPDPVIILYADAEKLIANIDQAVEKSNEEEVKTMWPKVRDASGLAGLKRFICTDGFDGKDWSTRAFIEAPAPRSGLLTMLDSPPLSDELLKVVPQSATVVFAGKLDIARFLAQVREAVGKVDPQGQKFFDQGMGAAQMAVGKNLQTDIFEPLGEDWAIYVAPPIAGGGATGMIIVNKLDDPKKAEQGLVSLAMFANSMLGMAMREAPVQLSIKNTKVDGMTIWYFAAPLVSPAWAVKDGFLYAGLYPQSVSSAARFASSGGKSFLENSKWQALKQRLAAPAPRGLSFVDLPETAGTGYQILLVYLRLGLGMADMWGVQAPEPVLPSYDQLLAHLAPAGSVSWVDEAGWHYKGIAPFPGSGIFAGEQGLIMVAAPALMTSIMLPSLNRARETANRVKCASNLRQIGQGMLLFSNDNRGKYPADIGELAEYIANEMGPQAANIFICPSGNTQSPPHLERMTPQQIGAWVREHADYVYLGGGKDNSSPADMVLIYEKPHAHDRDGMNMLYGDGHVEFQTRAGAEKELKRANQGR